MAATVGEHVHLVAGADGDRWDFAGDLANRLAVGKLVAGGEVMPARPQEVGYGLGVIGAAAQPEGNVAAEHATEAHSWQPGEEAAAAAGPRRAAGQRRPVQADGETGGQRVDHADPHLLLVLFRPVDSPAAMAGAEAVSPN